MSAEFPDLAPLTERVADLCPGARAALLVGSAALRRRGPISDFDVTTLDPSIPPGRTRKTRDRHDGRPLMVSAYHPQHFLSLCQLPELILPNLREMRKVRQGLILFDPEGQAAASRQAIGELRIPASALAPFVAAVDRETSWDTTSPPAEQRLELYYQLECLIFGWLHSRVELRFSKPKWLFEDLRQISSAAVRDLTEGLANELTEVGALEPLVDDLGSAAEALEVGPAAFYLRDARSLLDHGETATAVPSLRAGCVALCERLAARWDLPYRDLRSTRTVLPHLENHRPEAAAAVSSALLLDRRLEQRLVGWWKQARLDFLAVMSAA